jgi:RNA polymerase sigma-54 factor
VVESLDDDGYLRQPLTDLIGDSELDPPPDEQELEVAVKRVQSLEPAGVAARSVSECLLLQLPAIECPRMRELARSIVTDHLDSLAAKDVPRIAQRLDTTQADVEAVCHRIRHLDPRPGWRFDAAHVQYITPDVVVKRVRGHWTALLNPAVVPRVRINHVYAELFQRHRASQHTELAAHLQEARWTLRNVEQRFVTILSVANAIIRRQRRFFELGPMAMKPLGLKEIAEETCMHESTVSRVTNNKYMSTPLGVFELKYFFSRAMTSTSGSAYSGTAVRGLIKDMIEEEKPSAPLSDAQIAQLLAQQGLAVARRTVTKYRQALRIDPVDRRRVHA